MTPFILGHRILLLTLRTLSWAKTLTFLKGFVREAIGISLLNPTDYSTYQFIEIKNSIATTERIYTRVEFLTSVNTKMSSVM